MKAHGATGADRKGHDRRYAIDPRKIRQELGWQPTRSAWPEALEATIEWYESNQNWWCRIHTGEYRRSAESPEARVSG